MENILDKFEKWITYVLLVASMIVISFQVIQLIIEMGNTIWARITMEGIAYDPQKTSNYAVLFFSILLSLEVMETIRLFHHDQEVKIRLIFIVAMIAISRKLLALSTPSVKGETIDYLTTAGLILAFAVGYYLIRKVEIRKETKKGEEMGDLRE